MQGMVRGHPLSSWPIFALLVSAFLIIISCLWSSLGPELMLNYVLGILGGFLGGAGEEGSIIEQISKHLEALMKAPIEDTFL